MTPERLKEIEDHYNEHWPMVPKREHIPELIAEIHRLEELIRQVEFGGSFHDESCCPWCDGFLDVIEQRFDHTKHDPKCPAFRAVGAVR